FVLHAPKVGTSPRHTDAPFRSEWQPIFYPQSRVSNRLRLPLALVHRYLMSSRRTCGATKACSDRCFEADGPLPAMAARCHFFNALPRNSNNALVAGSSGKPRSALILLCVVSRAPKTV